MSAEFATPDECHARDVTPEDIERFEKLQRPEREGDQAVR